MTKENLTELLDGLQVWQDYTYERADRYCEERKQNARERRDKLASLLAANIEPYSVWRHGTDPVIAEPYYGYDLGDCSDEQLASMLAKLSAVVGRFTSMAESERTVLDKRYCSDANVVNDPRHWVKITRKPKDENWSDTVSVTYLRPLTNDCHCKVETTTQTTRTLVCEVSND